MLIFGLLALAIWLFAGVGLLLHWLTPRYGLIPLLFFIAGIVAVSHMTDLVVLLVEVRPGFIVTLMTDVLIPTLLVLLLVVYVSDGTAATQYLIYGMVGVNVLAIGTLAVMRLLLVVLVDVYPVSGVLTMPNLIEINLRTATAGGVAIIADVLVIAVFYQGVTNRFPDLPRWMPPVLALLAAMWTDALVFGLLSDLGTPDFYRLLPGDVLAKTFVTLVVSPLLAVYLLRFAPKLPRFAGGDGRPTFDILDAGSIRVRSALRQTEAALRESKSTYLQLTNHIEEVFWLADVNLGKVYYLSPAFERITGYEPELLYLDPGNLLNFVHDDDRKRVRQRMSGDWTHTFEDEFRIRRADGEVRWIRNRAFPVRNEHGRVYRVAGLAEDITEKKALEQDRRELAIERARTRTLREFISDATHDLRSPLMSIDLKLNMLENAKTPQEHNRHLADLKERVQNLSDLITDVFTLSLLESGPNLSVQPVDMNRMAAKIVEQVQPQALEKGLRLTLSTDPTAKPMVVAEAGDLARGLANLVRNAVRYTPQGSVSVRVWMEEREVVFSVTDTGIGIDKADLPKVFDRFFRAGTAVKADIDGTGLGLAIAHRVVNIHGGSIEVESEVGVGTTFTVRLPAISNVA